MEYEKQTLVVSKLREILKVAQLQLQASEPLSPPFQFQNTCAEFCSGLAFAPGCQIAPVDAFANTSETLCKRASPMGLGLLMSPLNGRGCCQINATEGPCELVLVGPGAENLCQPCSDWYTPELSSEELFLPLNREWNDTKKTCTETDELYATAGDSNSKSSKSGKSAAHSYKELSMPFLWNTRSKLLSSLNTERSSKSLNCSSKQLDL